MLRFLKSLFSVQPHQTNRRRSAAKYRRPQLGLEALEQRDLMAVGIGVVNGDLYVYGTSGPDTIEVRYQDSKYEVKDLGGNRTLRVAASMVTGGDVVFYGKEGDDYFWNASGLRTIAHGGDGDDRLIGGGKSDSLYGQAGSDTLEGGNGNDYLDGGADIDYLFGHAGKDKLHSGPDAAYNYLNGGEGDDILYGGAGIDYMMGYGGNDVLYGYSGDDHMEGGDGGDTMYGHGGNDHLYGADGWDFLYGGDGDDDLNGGNDSIDDYLYGGAGRDTFRVNRDWDGFPFDGDDSEWDETPDYNPGEDTIV